MNNKVIIGNVAVNSIVKFPRRSTKYQVLEHKNGYTRLQELRPDFTKEVTFFGPAELIVIDWFSVYIVEGF